MSLKAVPKPAPPAAETLTAEEQARRSLAAMGLNDVELRHVDRDQAVLDALTAAWRELRRPPTQREVGERMTPRASPHMVRDTLFKLRADGRIVTPRYGVNVPVVPDE